MTERTGKAGGPIAWMAGNHVAANLIMFVCLIGGLIMFSQIRQEVFPDLDLDQVRVTVAYPGASPEEVERGIVLAVEEAIRGLDGIDEIRSTAAEGVGTVTAELIRGADLQQLYQDIRSEVDRIITFPEEAEEPEVRIVSRKREVLTIVVHGQTPRTVLRELTEDLRDVLLQDPGITQVELGGARSLEIGVSLDQAQLRRYGLTLGDLAARLRSRSLELPGGQLETPGGDLMIRMKERRDYGREFARLPVISPPGGTDVELADIADVQDGFAADEDRHAIYDGEPALMLTVFRVGEQTPITVADAVRAQLQTIRPTLPPGIAIDELRDMSEIYAQRVNLLLRNGALGLVLVLILLGIFLEARLAFWVMLGIPISFLGSMLALPMLGVSINMVSLFAYIIALGIVVDDAIVVGENIYYHHQQGLPFMQAAVRGAREVAMPVTFSIMTNIVAFLPLYFIPGTMGKIFKMIPLVVSTAFLISLIESLFVLPAHLGHQRDRRRHGLMRWLHGKQRAFSDAFVRWINTRYSAFLAGVLRRRYFVFAVAVAVLTLTLGYVGSGRMGMDLFPRVESDFARVTVTLPVGSPVETTEAVVRRLKDAAHDVIRESGHDELLEGIFADIGAGGNHRASMRAFLADAEVRRRIGISTQEFVERWREATGPVPGVESIRFQSDFGGPGGGPGLTVELSHRKLDVLEAASAELAEALATYPQVSDIDDGFQPGKEQIDFRMTAAGESLGLTARDVANQLRHAFYGAEAIRQQRGRNEIKIMVRRPVSERDSEYDLESLLLRTPAGGEIPLDEAVERTRGRAYTTIDRRDGRRVVSATANVEPRSEAPVILEDLQRSVLPGLVAHYPGLSYSFEGRQADMRESLGSLKTSFLMAMLAIFAMLAVPFRSYIQPLIVMVSIPFGIIGAVAGHLIMGYSLSVISMLGIVALSGVVVNDSLVLIEYANRRRRQEDLSPHDAVHMAGLQRFRPIMLTTFTTFGGLSPMILETSLQARFLIPMAISLGFGILFATLITLVLVPSLYLILDDASRLGAEFRDAFGQLTRRRGNQESIISS
ncbi:efflux RND transporter permease subunit [Kiritimatiella glycovorans]|uniref:Multidrug transporter MdtB n=1 Tax=Kiritimatiella glycovorans TaxID=1307763 RepID=A0A0G3EBY6_9BACT|nr:efflux RND transporter permease subunit [Kiritimatiella glycovorans]AKJ63986.1 Multidrug transporter MdtB [Kiritimatiella glycovorans]